MSYLLRIALGLAACITIGFVATTLWLWFKSEDAPSTSMPGPFPANAPQGVLAGDGKMRKELLGTVRVLVHRKGASRVPLSGARVVLRSLLPGKQPLVTAKEGLRGDYSAPLQGRHRVDIWHPSIQSYRGVVELTDKPAEVLIPVGAGQLTLQFVNASAQWVQGVEVLLCPKPDELFDVLYNGKAIDRIGKPSAKLDQLPAAERELLLHEFQTSKLRGGIRRGTSGREGKIVFKGLPKQEYRYVVTSGHTVVYDPAGAHGSMASGSFVLKEKPTQLMVRILGASIAVTLPVVAGMNHRVVKLVSIGLADDGDSQEDRHYLAGRCLTSNRKQRRVHSDRFIFHGVSKGTYMLRMLWSKAAPLKPSSRHGVANRMVEVKHAANIIDLGRVVPHVNAHRVRIRLVDDRTRQGIDLGNKAASTHLLVVAGQDVRSPSELDDYISHRIVAPINDTLIIHGMRKGVVQLYGQGASLPEGYHVRTLEGIYAKFPVEDQSLQQLDIACTAMRQVRVRVTAAKPVGIKHKLRLKGFVLGTDAQHQASLLSLSPKRHVSHAKLRLPQSGKALVVAWSQRAPLMGAARVSADTEEVEVVLLPATERVVTLLGKDGKPVPNARLHYGFKNCGATAWVARSDASGKALVRFPQGFEPCFHPREPVASVK